jgi:hypothetical protein
VPALDSSVGSELASALATVSILPDDLAFVDGFELFEFDLSNEDNVIVGEPFVSSYGDFVATTQMGWGNGALEDYCGFIFRRDETGDNYYTIEIDRRGSVRFFIRADGEWVPGEANSSGEILTNVSDVNDLVLVAQGDNFVFFVNGQEVLSMVDDTHTESGGVSIMSGTFEGSNEAGCSFVNSRIWDLSTAANQ